MANKNNIKKRKLHRDCWSLDASFIIWLNEHLKVYLKDADKIVDLEYNKFEYNGKEYTHKELIKRMIYLSNYLIKYYYLDTKREKVDELLDIWKLVFSAMWW